jgi:hypothetical protein
MNSRQNILDIIDALPSLPEETVSRGFGPNAQRENIVDIGSIFKNASTPVIFGFSRKAFLKLAVKTELPASVLVPVQDYVYRDGLRKYTENAPQELPLVVVKDGVYYVQNHTRVAAQILNGRSEIQVRLVEHIGGKAQYCRPQIRTV